MEGPSPYTGHGWPWPAMAGHGRGLGHGRTSQCPAETPYTISNPGWVPDQIRKIGSEWAPEVKQNIGNPYQTEDNKNPRGRREAPPPWGAPKAPLVVFCLVRISYVLPHFRSSFWADFPNLVRIWPGTHPGFEIVFFFLLKDHFWCP